MLGTISVNINLVMQYEAMKKILTRILNVKYSKMLTITNFKCNIYIIFIVSMKNQKLH